MQQLTIQDLDRQIEQFMDRELPSRPTVDLSSALQVADFMESKGYGFRLKDMFPHSPDQTMWKAVFITGDAEFVSEDANGGVAICAAAASALEAAKIS